MSTDLYDKIVGDLASMDLSETTIFLHKEGEPLLDSFLFSRIAKIRLRAPHLHCLALNTNASLLDEGKAQQLAQSGIDKLFISLDGMTAYTYEQIRIGLHFDQVFQNILRFLTINQTCARPVHVVLQCLVSDVNRAEVDLFRAYWQDKPVELYFKAMHSYLDMPTSTMTSAKSPIQLRSCFDPFHVIVVYADGECGYCCWDYDNFFAVGNVKEHSLLAIFNDQAFTQIRLKHEQLDCADLVPCNRCLRIFGNDMIVDFESGEKSMQ